MKERLRVGVVGVGALGQHHARIYATLPDADLVGVYDVNRARAEEVAARLGRPAFASLEKLAAAAQAASVAVPTDRHREVFDVLAGHAVHMLVEKPLASTVEDARAMVQIAAERGLRLQVGHVERFNPVTRWLERHPVPARLLQAARLAPYPPPRDGAPPRGTEVSVVLDLMIHDLDLVLHLTRAPLRDWRAEGVPVVGPGLDLVHARLEFENGVTAHLTASRVSRERQRKLWLLAPGSCVELDYLNRTGRRQWREGGGLAQEDLPVEPGDPLTLELASFVDCVRNGRVPEVPGEDGLAALELAVGIERRAAGF